MQKETTRKYHEENSSIVCDLSLDQHQINEVCALLLTPRSLANCNIGELHSTHYFGIADLWLLHITYKGTKGKYLHSSVEAPG